MQNRSNYFPEDSYSAALGQTRLDLRGSQTVFLSLLAEHPFGKSSLGMLPACPGWAVVAAARLFWSAWASHRRTLELLHNGGPGPFFLKMHFDVPSLMFFSLECHLCLFQDLKFQILFSVNTISSMHSFISLYPTFLGSHSIYIEYLRCGIYSLWYSNGYVSPLQNATPLVQASGDLSAPTVPFPMQCFKSTWRLINVWIKFENHLLKSSKFLGPLFTFKS